MQRLRKVRQVLGATQIASPPLLGNGVWMMRFATDGQTETDASASPSFATEFGGTDLFKTFDTPIIRGRGFTDDDRATSRLVAVVSESVARRLWPGRGAIGQRIRAPGATTDDVGGGAEWRTVVGVARDTY